jgi:hypothetical protein
MAQTQRSTPRKAAIVAIAALAALAAPARADETPILGEVRDGKILLSRTRWFPSEQAAKDALARCPAVKNTKGDVFRAQPPFATVNSLLGADEQKHFPAPHPWAAHVYEEIPLVPPGSEARFDAVRDQHFLAWAWQYVPLVYGYPDDDGVVRRPKRGYWGEFQVERLRRQYDLSRPVKLPPGEYGATEIEVLTDTLKPQGNSGMWRFLYRSLGSVADTAEELRRAHALAERHLKVDDGAFKLGAFRPITAPSALPLEATPLGKDGGMRLRVRYAVGEITIHLHQDQPKPWHVLSGEAMKGTGEAAIAAGNGKVLGMGTRAVWPTGKHLIDFIGTKEMFEAILEKHHSRLGPDYVFDRKAWASEHVDYAIEELEKRAEREPDRNPALNMQFDDYSNYAFEEIYTWYDVPIVLPGYRKLSPAERKMHVAVLKAYLKEHKAQMTPANTYARRRILNCEVGYSNAYGLFYREFGRPPYWNEMQAMYESAREHHREPPPPSKVHFPGQPAAEVDRSQIPKDKHPR